MTTYDAVFVGAGHNALVCAAYLARAGWSVCLVDSGEQPGGLVRSQELTLPGFVHDTYSSTHPFFVNGPVFAELGSELEKKGLRYATSDIATGVSMPGGRSAIISTDGEMTAGEMRRLGETDAWQRLFSDFAPHAEPMMTLLGLDPTSPEAAPLLHRLFVENMHSPVPFSTALASSGLDLMNSRFASEELRNLILPWPLHIGVGPRAAGGAVWSWLMLGAFQGGIPIPVGGSGRLAETLTELVTEYGAEIRTRTTVDSVVVRDGRATGVRTTDGEEISGRRAVIASTTPDRLYLHLLRDSGVVPPAVRRQAADYRYGQGCLQISLALSGLPLFPHDSRLDRAVSLHLIRDTRTLLAAVDQGSAGYLPEVPTVSWMAPTAIDPGRAPEGKAIARIQMPDMPLHPRGDAAGEIRADGSWTPDIAERIADRVIAETERHLPGLSDLILARHVLTPADVAAVNLNSGAGDHAAGVADASQWLLHRPLPAQPGYASSVPGLWSIGAATWPGPGISGSSGRAVAKRLISDAETGSGADGRS